MTAGNSPKTRSSKQKRKIKTGLGSTWRYSGFCKTQYASDPECGGIPNFVRCHLCVIHLLDRIGQLPTMKVEVNDEGKYGRSLLHGRSVGRRACLHMARRQIRREGPGTGSGRVERNDCRHVRGDQRHAQGERFGTHLGITDFCVP